MKVHDLDSEITNMLKNHNFSMSSSDLTASLLFLARKGDTSKTDWLKLIDVS